MRRSTITLAIVALLVGLVPAAAAGGPKPDYVVDEGSLPFTALPDATALWGVHAGAGYRAEIPDEWNGSLVLWAHGYRGTGLELTVDSHPLREYLIANGFAWAASSYTANDYDVSSGVRSTHQLVQFLNSELPHGPDRVYLTGASMGGHITAASIEQYPQTYDAAMPICGVLGDVELFDFFLDFNVAAQQLGLGSSTFPVDPIEYATVQVPAIKANLELVPGGWPVVLNADGQAFKQLVELRSGGDRPNFDEAWFFWNSFPDFATGPGNFLFDLGATDGTLVGRPGVVVDNTDVTYQLDLDPALSEAERAFNEAVVRVEADRSARSAQGLSNVPIVTGDIDVPVLSLHNLGDLFVPFHNEIVYAQEVADHGKSDLLVQRAIRGVNHCDFTPFELVTAFADLVTWVETGVRPAGDVVLDPTVVAGSDYGCAFTDDPFGEHVLAAACP
jgi:pimeloyl-ACP methyl ester carboxylesterase